MFRKEKSSKHLAAINYLWLGVSLSRDNLGVDHNIGFHGTAPAGVKII